MALNLTVASRIFLMDPWWNPAAEYQAIDRAHRLGQHKPIRAVRLVMRSYLLLLTTHHSPLTTHHSPLTTPDSLLTTYYSLLTTGAFRGAQHCGGAHPPAAGG